ncbi:hypothetical protein N9545_04225 [Salibacteraceae bacterium]|jgi:hypothetical protein|nr:hypothetical protein [Salibacteraceae bacterium]MDB9710178.1 hypothetical protein [Salibacteraceae bacterium]MDC1220411.1 hypothetical protein [bacterium]MDC1304232.1 hypothetical protein [Salibacteraceae bacterium]
MDLKKTLFIAFVLLGTLEAKSQSFAGLSIGSSNNDNHIETVWFQHQLTDRFSAGVQLRYSQIRYRFVDAIAINDGSTAFGGLVLGFKLKETEKYRLNFNLTSSYRYLSNDERADLAESTNGLELDPNILLDIKLSNRIKLHTGAMLRTAMQFGDTPILDEQMPSAIVVAGLSYSVNNHSIALRAYTGPMNGATGDSMKYFNQVSLGYQFSFGEQSSQFSFFNF